MLNAEELSTIETPAVVIDLEVVDANITRMQGAITSRGVNLRPHVKSHKSVDLARRQLEAGAVGITVSSVGEAEVFADAGVEDIFLAYTIWAGSARRAGRIMGLHQRVRSFSVGVDSTAGAQQLANATRGADRPLRVLVEIDSGAHRTGVRSEEAGDLAAECQQLGLDVVGIFTYAGHAGTSKDARFSGAADEVHAVEQAIASLSAQGIPVGIVSAGSTPTAVISAHAPITESRPGEYIFNDADNVRLGTCESLADVGLFVATTVVSTAVEGQVIIDAGTKALGREGNAEKGYGLVPSLPGSSLRLLNEHHGYLSIHEGVTRPSVGDVLIVVPNHACPVANLFGEYIVIDAGTVAGRWPVDARGHLS
ncbi:alanine racemase [Leifsonia sp. 2MCAF36]|uniref:alanine racemase n=1 Tax=Leifsonia sp. 2MCAF36 TaxID=3232988 RepID=UPI003F9D5B81